MFKPTVRFTVDGREVSPSQVGSEMEKAIKTAAEEGIRKHVESITCPVHGEHAHVISFNRSGSQLTYDIGGCCDDLKEAVHNSFSE
jgi:hypothetical protein